MTSERSVLDFNDLTACANKIRQPGYWKLATEFLNGLPVQRTVWIEDASSRECKYDRKAIDPACAAAKCERIGIVEKSQTIAAKSNVLHEGFTS
jgi:hypothetical protein